MAHLMNRTRVEWRVSGILRIRTGPNLGSWGIDSTAMATMALLEFLRPTPPSADSSPPEHADGPGRESTPACAPSTRSNPSPAGPALPQRGRTVASIRLAAPGAWWTRWVCTVKSSSSARKMFGTKVWGLRSTSGNQVLWTWTMIRWPAPKV